MLTQKRDCDSIQENYSRINMLLILTAVTVTSLFSFLLVCKQFPSVWFDEVASIVVFTSDWKTMWHFITIDTHPPLYFIIMKILVSIVNDHFRVIKSIQLIPIIALHLWSGILVISDKNIIKKRYTGILSVLFIFLTFVPNNFMKQNVEIRMYSWALFFVTMSGIYAYLLIICKFQCIKNQIFFILFVLASALTHYYALFCEFFICLFILGFILSLKVKIKEKMLLIMKLFFPIFIGYSWWLPFALRQMHYSNSNIDWISFSFADLPKYVETFIHFDLKFELLFIGLIILEAVNSILSAKSGKNCEEKNRFITGLLFFSMPYNLLLTGVVLSVLFKPFLLERYLFPSLGLFWLGIILLISLVKDHKRIFCGLLTGICFFLFITNFPASLKAEYETGSKKTVQFVKERIQENDVFVTDINHLRIKTIGDNLHVSVLQYHFPNYPVLNMDDFISEIDTFTNSAWWFVNMNSVINYDVFTEHGFRAEKVYSGNFDNNYFYDLYKINRTNS